MKRKTGLQKKISSIFSGVAVPKPTEEDTPPSKATPPGKQRLSKPESPPAAPVQNPFAHSTSEQTPARETTKDAASREPLISSSLGTKVDLSRPIVDLPDILVEEETVTKKAFAKPVIYEPKLKSDTPTETTDSNEITSNDTTEIEPGPSPSEISKSAVTNFGSTAPGAKPSHTDPPKPVQDKVAPSVSSMDPLEMALLQRQRKMRIMIGILSIVFVAVLVWALKPDLFQSSTEPESQPNEGSVLTSLAAIPSSIQWTIPDPYPIDLRDPMVRVNAKPVKLPDPEPIPDAVPNVVVDEKPVLNIMGIVYSEDRPSVIIGTGVYFIGDIVEGVMIRSITRDEVGFEKDEKQWSTRLH
jgi:hypothetical protein